MEIFDVVIVGGGVSGLSLAWNLLKERPKLQIVVLDKGSRPGGCLRTLTRSGFHVELGANGVVDRVSDTLELMKELGLESEMIAANEAAKKRYLYIDGELVPIPEKPGDLFRSSLLSWWSRGRVLMEPLIPRGAKENEESVMEFARRRLGSQIADRFLDPFVSGVYAGDPQKLSLRAAFPKIYAMEREHGSLIRAAMKRRKSTNETADGVGRLWSLQGGMGRLTRTLADALGPGRIELGTVVTELEPFGPGWRIHLDGRKSGLLARKVVLSTPAYTASELLGFHCGALGKLLGAWPYEGIVTVALAYPRAAIKHPLDGFGYLVPSTENRPILGCLFSSSIYPGARSPDDQVLLRVMLGGARHPEAVDLNAEALVELAHKEVQNVLGIQGAPTMTQAIRWARALPQYNIGHDERVREAKALVDEFCPGVVLHSNAFHGVAVNDCVRASRDIAAQILAG